jgi:hypothetical protein
MQHQKPMLIQTYWHSLWRLEFKENKWQRN